MTFGVAKPEASDIPLPPFLPFNGSPLTEQKKLAKLETSERCYFNSVCMTLKLFFIIIAVLLTLLFGSIGGVLAHQFQWLPYRLVVRLEYLLFGHTLGKSDAYDQRAELLKSTRLPYTIAMLGDSLTAYAEWNILLKRHDILNFGIAGDTLDRMLRRVAANPIKGKTIFVMAGINDLPDYPDISAGVRTAAISR